jgi:hypothetical protein
MPVNVRRSLPFLALIAAIGCGASQSGGGQNGGGQDGGGQNGGQTGSDAGTSAFSEAQRGAAVQAIQAKMTALTAADGTVDVASLKAYMASRPELSNVASTGTGSIYGFFPDGVFYVAIANRKPTPGANANAKRGGPAPKMTSRRPRRNGSEIGPKDQVRLANGLGLNGFGDASPTIADYVSSRGYTPVTSSPGVEEMKTWHGDGAIYINTHGARLKLADGNTHVALWTSTPYELGDTTYLPELLPDASGNSVMGISTGIYDTDAQGKPLSETHYVVTDDWIAANLHLEPGSFVQLDVCNGGLLADAFQSAGADLVGGWSNSVQDTDGTRADLFVFDRFTGANQYAPESLPERPFDSASVERDLASRGWTLSPSAGEDGSLVLASFSFTGGDTFALLTPSIENMTVDEQAGRLTLKGIFGAQEDSSMVTVGGTELSNCDWGPTQVVCDIPPGGSGDVVASKRDHDSNAVPLTEWTGTIDYQETNDFSSMVAEVKATVSFRADLHAYRTTSGGDPIQPATAVFASEKQVSVVNYQGSGEACASGGCEELVGSGVLAQVFVPGPVPPPNFSDSYFFHGTADVQHGTVTVEYMAFATTGMTVVAPGAAIPFQVQVVPALVINGPGGSSVDWNLTMDQEFNIPDGSAHLVIPGSSGNGYLDMNWHFDVKNAPDPSRGEDDNAP